MSNKTFDILRAICEQVLPALGTLYFALAKIWGLPWGTEIVGTISAVAVCIGTIIGIKRALYNAIEMDDPDDVVLIPETYGDDEDGNEE